MTERGENQGSEDEPRPQRVCPIARNDCPDHAELTEFLCGRIDPARANELSELLDQCRECDATASRLESELYQQWKGLASTQVSKKLDAATISRRPGQTMETEDAHGSPVESTTAIGAWVGRYRILRKLGHGGMGVVYEAVHADMERHVAIKLIRGFAPDSQQKLRFESESRAAAQLEHPSIVRVYEVGESRGDPYLVMQLIDGETLSDRLTDGPMDARHAAELVHVLALAMQHAHASNVVHRDIKPGNVLIDQKGQAFITDFGLAKILGSDSDLTRSGQAIGTPSYMSPEQAGANKDEIDHLSDVYSLGAVLYACLTGRPPHQAASPIATILQVQTEEVIPPKRLNREVPRDLETICMKCLSKSPASRYAKAAHFADDLSNFLDGKPIAARPASAVEKAFKWTRRRPVTTALIAMIAIATVIGAVAINSMRYSTRLADSLGNTSRALKAAEEANERAEEAEYISQLAIAQLAWEQNDLRSMTEALQRAPERFRGWEHAYLSSLPNSMAQTLDANGPVFALLDDSDRNLVYVARGDRYDDIKVHDKSTLAPIRSVVTPNRQHRCVSLSNDGSMILHRVGRGMKNCVITDTVTSERVAELTVERGFFQGCFGPDDDTIAFNAYSKRPWDPRTFEVWNFRTGERLTSTPLFGPTRFVTLDPLGEWFAIGASADNVYQNPYSRSALVLFDTRTYEMLHRIPVGDLPVSDIEFSPDGSLIAVATNDHRITLLRRDDLTILRRIELDGAPYQICFHPDGTRLAVNSQMGSQWIGLYDIATGRAETFFRGHVNFPSGLAFSREGDHLLTAAADGKVHSWRVDGDPSRQELTGMTTPVMSIAFNSDGTRVCGVQIGNSLEPGFTMVWESARATVKHKIVGSQTETDEDATGTNYWARYLDDSTIVTLSWQNSLKHWDAKTGKLIRSLSHPANSGVHHAAISPDRRWIVSASDKEVFLWDLADGTVSKLKSGAMGTCMDVAFQQDSAKLLLVGFRLDQDSNRIGWLKRLDLQNQSDDTNDFLQFPNNQVNAVCSLGNDRAVIGLLRGDVRAYDLNTKTMLWESRSHRGSVGEICVNQNQTRVATTGEDRNCVIHDADSGTRLLNVPTNAKASDSVRCRIQFSPDDRTLAISVNEKIWLLNASAE